MRRLVRRQPPAPAREPAWDPLDRVLLERPERAGPVSEHLHGRVTGDDLAAMRAALSEDERGALAAAEPAWRLPYEVSLAVAHVAAARERTGLSAAEPPEHVHAILRGSLHAGGALYYADRFVEVLGDPGQARAVLDFGCSS